VVTTAHDIAEGGLACALAECAIFGGVGAKVELEGEFDVFGEGPGGFVLAAPREALEELAESLQPHGFQIMGETGGRTLDISTGVATLSVPVEAAQDSYEQSLPRRYR
jgi:phosphoribosylformylglycinamidine synthase